jgi:hypothetical protein
MRALARSMSRSTTFPRSKSKIEEHCAGVLEAWGPIGVCPSESPTGSPAPTTGALLRNGVLTITDGEHTLGGVASEAVKETTDEDPAPSPTRWKIITCSLP